MGREESKIKRFRTKAYDEIKRSGIREEVNASYLPRILWFVGV
jgi:hypothetical protein